MQRADNGGGWGEACAEVWSPLLCILSMYVREWDRVMELQWRSRAGLGQRELGECEFGLVLLGLGSLRSGLQKGSNNCDEA